MPDLDQIKQGEQVTTSALEGTGLAPRRDSERGDHRRGRSPRISDLAITALAVIWLQKQPGAAEDDLFAKGQSGNATGSTRRFHEPGHMGCRAVALPNSVRLIHNRGNLACCPDVKVSHYRPEAETKIHLRGSNHVENFPPASASPGSFSNPLVADP